MATHSSRNYPMDQKAPSSRVGMVDAENGESNKGEERPHTGVSPGVEAPSAFDFGRNYHSQTRGHTSPVARRHRAARISLSVPWGSGAFLPFPPPLAFPFVYAPSAHITPRYCPVACLRLLFSVAASL